MEDEINNNHRSQEWPDMPAELRGLGARVRLAYPEVTPDSAFRQALHQRLVVGGAAVAGHSGHGRNPGGVSEASGDRCGYSGALGGGGWYCAHHVAKQARDLVAFPWYYHAAYGAGQLSAKGRSQRQETVDEAIRAGYRLG